MAANQFYTGQFNYRCDNQAGVKTYSFSDKTEKEVNSLRRSFDSGGRTLIGECIRKNKSRPIQNKH